MSNKENHSVPPNPTGENPLQLHKQTNVFLDGNLSLYGDKKEFTSDDPTIQAAEMRYHPDCGHRVGILDAQWDDEVSRNAVLDSHGDQNNFTEQETGSKLKKRRSEN